MMYTYTRKTGYYVIARRGDWWKLMLGPFPTYIKAWRERDRVTLPDGATVDVKLVRGDPLRVIGDMGC